MKERLKPKGLVRIEGHHQEWNSDRTRGAGIPVSGRLNSTEEEKSRDRSEHWVQNYTM